MKKRVVVTGMGVVTTLGIGVDEFWKSLVEGKCGIKALTRLNADDFPCKVVAQIDNFEPTDYLDKKEAKRMDRFTHFAMVSAKFAYEMSGLDMEKEDAERVGVIIGSGIGGIETLEEQMDVIKTKGPGRVSPFFIPMMIANMASGRVAIEYGAKGFNECVCTACATGTNAIGDAYKVIQRGDADIIFTGGSEAPITPLSFAGFCSAKTMSTNPDPLTASRPFDAERNGFVMGEGSGVIILEEYEHALARGANILAEIIGYGCTDDAFHITAPADGAEGGARCMKKAIEDAGITTTDIGYINAHGTSTELNDKNETAAIKSIFGESADKVAVSSTKSMTGHLLGAAGAIEAIACIKALMEGEIPPTINLENPDPECDLDYVPNKARKQEIEYAMSNSFGFGGHNAVLIFKKYMNN